MNLNKSMRVFELAKLQEITQNKQTNPFLLMQNANKFDKKSLNSDLQQANIVIIEAISKFLAKTNRTSQQKITQIYAKP